MIIFLKRKNINNPKNKKKQSNNNSKQVDMTPLLGTPLFFLTCFSCNPFARNTKKIKCYLVEK